MTQRIGAVMRALAGGVYWKSVGGVLADLVVVVAAFIVAFHLRFGGEPPPGQLDVMIQGLPGVIGIKIVIFYTFGLYHGVWRHAGTPEIVQLVKASLLASLLLFTGLAGFFGGEPVSFSVLILDWMIATMAVGGTRFGFRALRQYFAVHRGGGTKVLVYGSRDHALLVLRHLRQRMDRTVIGLLDADPTRRDLQVQGVKVLGSVDALPEIAAEYDIDEVIVPVANTTDERRSRLVEKCTEAGVKCKYFAFSLQPAAEPGVALPSSAGDGAREWSPSSS